MLTCSIWRLTRCRPTSHVAQCQACAASHWHVQRFQKCMRVLPFDSSEDAVLSTTQDGKMTP